MILNHPKVIYQLLKGWGIESKINDPDIQIVWLLAMEDLLNLYC